MKFFDNRINILQDETLNNESKFFDENYKLVRNSEYSCLEVIKNAIDILLIECDACNDEMFERHSKKTKGIIKNFVRDYMNNIYQIKYKNDVLSPEFQNYIASKCNYIIDYYKKCLKERAADTGKLKIENLEDWIVRANKYEKELTEYLANIINEMKKQIKENATPSRPEGSGRRKFKP